MSILNIERMPSYLSPSSLSQAENMPNTFYLTRLMADPIPREPQSLAAGVGSAFDYYIKCKLCEVFTHKQALLPKLKNGIETNITEAFQGGKIAYNSYVESAFEIEDFDDIEIHRIKTVYGVPITGYLDATIKDKETGLSVPFDWKVSGYTAKSTMSPPQGYYRKWEGLMLKGSHKKYTKDISFEQINEKWAAQIATYGWLLNLPDFEPFPARVDNLMFKDKRIRMVAMFRAWITTQFQEDLVKRYQKVWSSLLDGTFIDSLASQKDSEIVWIASKGETWF